MTDVENFNPRWASCPGTTIHDLLQRKNISLSEAASACGIEIDAFGKLLSGALPVTQDIAGSLAATIGGSVSFWTRREERFREQEALLEADRWVQTLPLDSMKKLGWLEAPKDWRERIDACLNFFGVENLAGWHLTYRDQLRVVRFRSSPKFMNQISSVSSWLRAGELARNSADEQKFDPTALSDAILEIRELTRIPDPADFLPRLQALTQKCGVSCVIVPTPEGCAASGASRILADGTALIQLSGRFLSDDHFWFTLFHEIAHLLLHQGSTLHVDGDPEAIESSATESEANTFAVEVLWPSEDRPSLKTVKKPSRRDVTRMAIKAGVSPGIIVGQLQNCGTLHHSEYNNLKRRYIRDGASLRLKKKQTD